MSLTEYRKEIDAIDAHMLELLQKRMDVARKVGAYKAEHGMAVTDAAREKEIIHMRQQQAENADYAAYVAQFMRCVMELSKAEQRKVMPACELAKPHAEEKELIVAYQGIAGAYGELAARAYFPEAALCPVSAFDDVFCAVMQERADYGVVPADNVYAGAVMDVYELLTKNDCFIVGEQMVGVQHCLLGLSGVRLSDIKEVYSHPQALAQCREVIQANGWRRHTTDNTASAAKAVRDMQDKTCAAIASPECAEEYGLHVLNGCLRANNQTRFLILGRQMRCDESSDKTSIVFTTRHEQGALCDALACFKHERINLLKIESCPSAVRWEYDFFADFEGSVQEAHVQRALSALEKIAKVRVLGCYRACRA
ncbi:MAG: bifunctional chorismate mutase/prephenate dehydratase [Christensenellales bacterium]|jgi:chorismate mutase/prephenate dehydratase